MIPTLRPYQREVEAEVVAGWNAGAQNMLAVLPTGSGKTVMFSHTLATHRGASVAIAHRQELVSQISLSLARFGLVHRIIGPRDVIRLIIDQHNEELGRSFYDPNAAAGVAGVDTLVRRAESLRAWLSQVSLWVQDEAHHVLTRNKWGKAVDLFPNARGSPWAG